MVADRRGERKMLSACRHTDGLSHLLPRRHYNYSVIIIIISVIITEIKLSARGSRHYTNTDKTN
jgi:hypothetical protein